MRASEARGDFLFGGKFESPTVSKTDDNRGKKFLYVV